MRLSWLAVIAVLVLSGCNTMRQGVSQEILVRTPGVDNAYCDLYTEKNRYAVITTREVVIERTDMPLTVICRKTGYYTASVIVEPDISAPGMPLNLANGILPGAAWDIASNSIYAYPDTITVVLLPMPPEALPPDTTYVLQKKPEPVKPEPKKDAPPPDAADKSLSKSSRK